MYETDSSEWIAVMGYITFLVTITALVISKSIKKE